MHQDDPLTSLNYVSNPIQPPDMDYVKGPISIEFQPNYTGDHKQARDQIIDDRTYQLTTLRD